ncbi:hypothetical protein OF829_08855 [Sphingomonas sp. LB-2]|uniref:hypothetical protein n=1 Tax=Sphingomonas caeni TaxID=2984949 RepID=UPI00223248AA|nr:hypothetical protein [Sphingomonas caeni]MCW3847349.1 hypothetical protein [Sphingomonas caeni]
MPTHESHRSYGKARVDGRLRADEIDFCPVLGEFRRRGESDDYAIAFARGFYHRCLETDPINATDRVADFWASIGGCAGLFRNNFRGAHNRRH